MDLSSIIRAAIAEEWAYRDPYEEWAPSGRRKRRKRWQPAGTLTATAVDGETISLSYSYQFGNEWYLYDGATQLSTLPSGGFTPYTGTYLVQGLTPATSYTFSLRHGTTTVVSTTGVTRNPIATITATVLDWNNVSLSYTYQYGTAIGLYMDETLLATQPSGGSGSYNGTLMVGQLQPGTEYVFSIRWNNGATIIGSHTVTTWAHNFPETYDMPDSGDVKTSLQPADHSNWFLLDGRAVSSLPPSAAAAALLLGYTTNLPNAQECVVRSDNTYLGEVTGQNSVMLNRNQLPNVTLPVTGTTSTDGSHSHEIPINADPPGTNFSVANGASQVINGGNDRYTFPAGAHSHTFTTTTGSINGNVLQQAIDLVPQSFNINLFMWLM